MSDKTPPPVSVNAGDLLERRRRHRASEGTAIERSAGATGTDAALAVWEASADTSANTAASEPPAPDADLVLDVTDELPVFADHARAKADAFEGDLPAEATASEAVPAGGFGFAALRDDFDAMAVASRLAAARLVTSPTEATALRLDAANLLLEELNVALEGSASTSVEIATAATAAARAAALTDREQALSLYRQALAVEPAYAPALRGVLGLAVASGDLSGALQAAAGLADAVPLDRRAYLQIASEATPAGNDGDNPEGENDVFRSVRAAEQALRAGDGLTAATACDRLAERVGGDAAVALRALAAMLRQLESGTADAATGAAADTPGVGAPSHVFARLREALVLPAAAALPHVLAVLDGLPSSPLTPALCRWAARLARQAGDAALAQGLIERARAAGAELLPVLDGLDAISADVATTLDALTDRLGRVPNEVVGLLAERLASALIKADRVADGLSLLGQALARDPESGPALAPLCTQVLADATHAAFHDQARALLMAFDPSRRAEVRLHDALGTLATPVVVPPDEATGVAEAQKRADAHAALARHGEERGDPALLWCSSWYLRGAGRPDEATAALAAAARGFARQAPLLAQALEARAGILSQTTDLPRYLATLPDLQATPLSEGPTVVGDPGALARALVDGERDPRGLAAQFALAATTHNAYRVYEAAGWAVQSGNFPAALGLLAAAPADVGNSDTGTRLLLRLMRLGDDPSAAATLLRERAAASTADSQQQALFLHLGAEALERAGRRAEAALIYRELLASPLAKDADLALRRALLVLGDAEGLLGFWRDELDACSGSGRDRAAAEAALEKVRVALDFSDDRKSAAADIETAVALCPDSLAALVLAICQPRSLVGSAARVKQVEALAKAVSQQAPALLFLAGLLADGEDQRDLARGLFHSAVQASAGRPAIDLLRRHLLAEETGGATPSELADILGGSAAALAKSMGVDPRLVTALFLRAAETAESAGDLERAEVFTTRALALEPSNLPALVRLHGLQQVRGDEAAALKTLETEAAVLRDPGRRAAALFAAAEVAADELGDTQRSSDFLTQVLDINPRHDGAFARQRRLFDARGDEAALAGLLGRRAQVLEPTAAVRLRLERTDLLLGTLADRINAKRELREILAVEPQNLFALRTLSALELEDGAAKAAADLSWQQVHLERDPGRLLDCLLRLGRIYRGPLADVDLALSAYERALALSDDHREALEALSELYTRAGDNSRGIAVIDRLLELETDPERRRPLLLRLGTLWEATGDVRRAGVSLRHAADEYPRNLEVIGDLVRFYERQSDQAARNFLLDGAIGLFRADVRLDRDRVSALRGLVSLLRWRQRPANALSAAQLYGRLAATPATRAEAAALAASAANALGQDGRARMHAIARLRGDERGLPADLPPGLTHVMRLLGPSLVRTTKTDLKRFQVGRAEKQPRGSQVRTALDEVAAELGVRDFDVYVAMRLSHAMAVEPGEPPVVIVGAGIAAQGGIALRFAAAYCMRLIETNFSLLLRDGPLEAAALVAGLVRNFAPEHRPPLIPDLMLEAATAQVSRTLTRSLRNELAPLAVQLAAIVPDALYTSVFEAAARAGLVACGDIAVALDVLAGLAGRAEEPIAGLFEIPLVARLVDFSLSEEYDALMGGPVDQRPTEPPSV